MNSLKLTGIIGFVGAILCGTGEFLLHFDPSARFSGYDFMADISDARLTRGHFFAVVGVPLYFVGMWHIAEMLRPAGEKLSRALFLIGCFGFLYGAMPSSIPEDTGTVDRRAEIAQRWSIWREEKQKREQDDHNKGINSASIFTALTRQAPEDAAIAVDVGNNTYSFGRYFEATNQRILMSGYLGSIGFAFSVAMGAWAANTGRPILSVSGDGGFCQYLAEFTTAVKYKMNITHLLLNNFELGKISKEQRAGEWPVWQTTLHNPNFAEYAQNCGGHGVRVEHASELDNALAAAIAHDGPALVEVMSDAELI